MQSIANIQAQRSLAILRLGSKGEDVKLLQQLLNSYGYSLVVDGDFGSRTDAAVKGFQRSRGLVVDGIVGINTWNALLPNNPSSFPTLRRGSRGYYVTFLQERLNIFGYPVAVDGIFGSITEATVKNFQRDQGLLVDGIVGPMTWRALNSIDFN
ncbi:peptidoglycan-binding protein [Aerosakkonemataceae cyanobacterium BLCC-F154]|uniref:Peptidoglycan-binding protein n=1 Tax=Floridaenema fluviatile BLCC-F154 TaxID=3153640 RepID=A0ABV4YJY0_9CYAN